MRRLGVALLLVLTACGTTPSDRATGLGWERLPDPPLSPRSLGALHWTGTELLALGGDTVPPCPPGASCVDPPEPQRDGAAYDPTTRTWRPTAVAPLPLVGRSVVAGDVVWAQSGWRADAPLLSYDASDDAWTEHPAPPGPARASYVLAVSQGRPVALRSEQRTERYADAVYDPATRTWEALPTDPLAPSFDRTAVETSRGLLVTGAEAVDNPGSEQPTLVRAALLDVVTGTWRRLPDSDQLTGHGIAVHGDRAVWPDLTGADGGQVNGYGRRIPAGGVLDLATGTWERLPDVPDEDGGGWPVFALGGPVSASSGYLYDDRSRSWTFLAPPSDGPAQPGAAGWAGDDLVVVGGLDGGADRGAGLSRPVRAQGAWLLRR